MRPFRASRRHHGDPGLAKDARDLDLPPWNKGRYGTAIGRAVHAVLQTVDLATGAGIDDTAAAQAAAEGVVGTEHEIAAASRARSPATRCARRSRAGSDVRCTWQPRSGPRRSRATSTSSTAPKRSRRRRLQDRRVARRRRPRRQGGALPAPGRVVRARAGDRDGRAGGRLRVPVPRHLVAPKSGPSVICGRRWRRYEHCSRRRPSRHHTSTPPTGPVTITSAV